MSETQPNLDGLKIDRRVAPAATASPALWITVVIVLGLVVLAVLWWMRPKAVPVRTVLAREVASANGGALTVLNGSGYVVARREATVSSKVTGKVVEVFIEEGMKVEKDQVLARLDAVNTEASLRLAEAQFASAQSLLAETRVRLEQASREARRVTELAAQKIASPSELDRAEVEYKSLEARLVAQTQDVTVAERQVALWKQQLEDTVIRAPFAGIAVAKNAQPGEMISPMSAGGGFTRTGIGTIVDMSSLEIEVEVSESYIGRVEPGQPVEATLDAYADWKIPCKVLAIIPTADRQKSTVKVRVAFDKLDPRMLPQMGVKVAFRSAKEAAPTATRVVFAPRAAVRRQDGRDYVLVVQSDRVERRAVTAGLPQGDDVPVLNGLNGGERVVREGPETLKTGDRVKEIKP